MHSGPATRALLAAGAPERLRWRLCTPVFVCLSVCFCVLLFFVFWFMALVHCGIRVLLIAHDEVKKWTHYHGLLLYWGGWNREVQMLENSQRFRGNTLRHIWPLSGRVDLCRNSVTFHLNIFLSKLSHCASFSYRDDPNVYITHRKVWIVHILNKFIHEHMDLFQG